MKKKTGQQSIETHDISQRQYPMPGTDLGETTAIPYNECYDVDLSGGPSYCRLGHGDDCSKMSFILGDNADTLIPARNPTSQRKLND